MSELQQIQPTTAELHDRYGVSQSGQLYVAEQRLLLSEGIDQHERTFISIDGPCPLTINPEQTEDEAQRKLANAAALAGYIGLDRECFYKPRTHDEDWHGVDEDRREEAYVIVSELGIKNGNVVAEIGSIEQYRRYGHALVAVWTGGRNVRNDSLIRDLAVEDDSVPIFVKNGLDGDIEPALRQIDEVDRLRGGEGAPAVLIYRGGENALNPYDSQEQYKRAHEATGGKIFYDTAHGVEMAYHPKGLFKKSVIGQMRASQALIQMSEQGYPPLGKLSEASDIDAIMDPHMPLDISLRDSRDIHTIKIGSVIRSMGRRVLQPALN